MLSSQYPWPMPIDAGEDPPRSSVVVFQLPLGSASTTSTPYVSRANAWAKGDLEAIQKLNFGDKEESCLSALMNSSFMKVQPGLQSIEARMLDAWVASAEKSLATNASTFAMLQLRAYSRRQGEAESDDWQARARREKAAWLAMQRRATQHPLVGRAVSDSGLRE
jgi:hypothetical protein